EAVQHATSFGGFGDVARHGGRAVHARQHADIVAHADAAVLAAIAQEAARLLAAMPGWRALGRGPQLGHGEIVDMDMRAGRDPHRRRADHLAVFAYRAAGRDIGRRDLVAGGDGLARRDCFARDRRSGPDAADRDDDVVVRVQTYRNGILDENHAGSFALAGRGQSLTIRGGVWPESRKTGGEREWNDADESLQRPRPASRQSFA